MKYRYNMVDKDAVVNDDTVMSTWKNMPAELWKVTFDFQETLCGDLPEKISETLEDLALAVLLHNKEATDGDDWTLTLTVDGKPDAREILRRVNGVAGQLLRPQDIHAEKLPEQDWLQHVHDNFPPLVIGSFFVYGSHYAQAPPANLIPLKIDAATAFGSGEHETTRGCLQALEKLRGHDFKNGLDMGCGSGILAIALIKFWPDIKMTAVDIDPESITVTKRHAEMNGVGRHIYTEAGDGYRAPSAKKNGPYDIIMANILANPLIDMAPDLAAALKPGGYAVLSGLLKRQKDDVVAAHVRQGLVLASAEEIGDWQALVFKK